MPEPMQQMPQMSQDQWNQLIMQYIASQMMQPKQGQQPNQPMQEQQPQAPAVPMSKMELLMKYLSGNSQFGIAPHMSSFNDILERLERGSMVNQNQNGFEFNPRSSYGQAHALANKPLTGWQKAGQFLGAGLQDLAPLIGGAGGAVFGPLGMLAGPAAGTLGRLTSNYSQPYQLPTG